MSAYITNLISRAREQAREYKLNEDKEKSFIAGAKWAVEQLVFMVRGHGHYESMMDKSTKDYLSKLSLHEVRKFVEEITELKFTGRYVVQQACRCERVGGYE